MTSCRAGESWSSTDGACDRGKSGQAQSAPSRSAAQAAIFAVMVTAIGVLLLAGITCYEDPWQWASLALLTGETVVSFGNGMRCPLTPRAVRYGAEKGHAFDTVLPERLTRHTFRFFGTLAILGMALPTFRWAGAIT